MCYFLFYFDAHQPQILENGVDKKKKEKLQNFFSTEFQLAKPLVFTLRIVVKIKKKQAIEKLNKKKR